MVILVIGISSTAASGGSVSGLVTDRLGRPIAAAVIEVRRRSAIRSSVASTFSNERGWFSIGDMGRGNYLLVVEATGYLPTAERLDYSGGTDTTIQLMLDSAVAAKFEGKHGLPSLFVANIIDRRTKAGVAGAYVRVQAIGLDANADKEGFVSFTGRQCDSASFTISAVGYRDTTVSGINLRVGEATILTVELEPVDWAPKKEINVENGDSLLDSCKLPLILPYDTATTMLSGIVSDIVGNFIVNATVSIDTLGLSVRTDDAGIFDFTGLAAGKYRLSIAAPGFDTAYTGPITVVSGDRLWISVVMNNAAAGDGLSNGLETEPNTARSVSTSEQAGVEQWSAVSSVTELQRVRVFGRAITTSEGALLKQRAETFAVGDLIGAQEMSRAGAGNAAEAMKFVPGVTIVEERFPIVRGLGDRYIRTTLNGLEMPASNPDRNAVALDMFPSGLVENLCTQKTYCPSMNGNFSGGSVNVLTRAVTEKPTIAFSIGSAANDLSTFRTDILTSRGGSLDWLGYDDGTRAVPKIIARDPFNLPGYGSWTRQPPESAQITIDRLNEVSRAFDTPFSTYPRSGYPDQSYSLTIGSPFYLFYMPVSFMGCAVYTHKLRSQPEGTRAVWDLPGHEDEWDTLFCERLFSDKMGKREVSLGALATATGVLSQRNRVNASYLYIHTAEDKNRRQVSRFHYQLPADDPYIHLRHHEIRYIERGLHFLVFDGTHSLAGSRLEFAWRAGLSDSRQDEPDARLYSDVVAYRPDTIIYNLTTTLGTAPTHAFRFTQERGVEAGIDCTIPFVSSKSDTLKITAGGALQAKRRTLEQESYILQHWPHAATLGELNGDIDAFVSDNNMGVIRVDTNPSTGRLVYRVGNTYVRDAYTDTSSQYQGIQTVGGVYINAEYPIMQCVRLRCGVRLESIDMTVKSRNRSDPKYSGGFSNMLLLPTTGAVWTPIKQINIQFAYARTYAKPIFRELAPYLTSDPALGSPQVGNAKLELSHIDNVDLRWDFFPNIGEIFSASLFFKYLWKPIEQVFVRGAQNREMSWQNGENSRLFGIEIEGRKRLGFITPMLNDLAVGGNATLVSSRTRLDPEKAAVIDSFLNDPPRSKPLSEASPYAFNANIQYDNAFTGISAGLYFNIFGSRLIYATPDQLPDGYEYPRPELSLTVGYKRKSLALKVTGKNLLDSETLIGHLYKGGIYARERYRKGRTWGISVTYTR